MCITGFERVNGVCVLDCPPNQFLANGVCISCPGNATFFPLFQVCFCNQGFSTVNGVSCVPDTIACPLGQRYDNVTSACVNCTAGCNQCLNTGVCISCPTGFRPSLNQCVPICGNGVISGTEACDDGNTNNNDGCSSTCAVEPSYECIGTPSICTLLFCGDRKISPSIGEQCDDGGTASGDGCSATCQV